MRSGTVFGAVDFHDWSVADSSVVEPRKASGTPALEKGYPSPIPSVSRGDNGGSKERRRVSGGRGEYLCKNEYWIVTLGASDVTTNSLDALRQPSARRPDTCVNDIPPLGEGVRVSSASPTPQILSLSPPFHS